MPARPSISRCYFRRWIQTISLVFIVIMNLVGICLLVALLVIERAKGSYDFELSAQAPSMMILSTMPQTRVSRYDVTLEALDQIEKVRAEVLARLPQAWAQSTQPCSGIPYPFFNPFFSSPQPPTPYNLPNMLKPSYETNEITESMPSTTPEETTPEPITDPYSPDFSGWGPPPETEKMVVGPPSIRPDDDFDSTKFETDGLETTKEVQRDTTEEEKLEFLSNEVTLVQPVSLLSAKTGLSTPPNPSTSTFPTPPPTAPKVDKVFLEIDCSVEKNEHPTERCKNWAQAGYCERHPATKYLFCRQTCLCRTISAAV